jgi:hypothetical protein
VEAGQVAEAAVEGDDGDRQVAVPKQGGGPFEPVLREQIEEGDAEFLTHYMPCAIDAQAQLAGEVGQRQPVPGTVIDDMEDPAAAVAGDHRLVDAGVLHPAFQPAGELPQALEDGLRLRGGPGRQPWRGRARREGRGAQDRQVGIRRRARPRIQDADHGAIQTQGDHRLDQPGVAALQEAAGMHGGGGVQRHEIELEAGALVVPGLRGMAERMAMISAIHRQTWTDAPGEVVQRHQHRMHVLEGRDGGFGDGESIHGLAVGGMVAGTRKTAAMGRDIRWWL